MFDQLFKKPETLARHRAAPLLEERLAFLAHQAGRGVFRCIHPTLRTPCSPPFLCDPFVG
jgi:hypothetical protein